MRHRALAFLAAALAAATAAAASPTAASANPELKEARRLLDELFIDKAGEKFVEALERGDSDPATTAQIYLGLGEVAASNDEEDKALEFFKKALAIDTLLDLPPGTSPKVAEPLQKARALFRGEAKKLELATNIDTASGVRASASVLSDPFSMVAGVTVDLIDGDGERQSKTINTDAKLIPIPLTPESKSIVVSLIDEHGNKLVTNDKVDLPDGERIGGPEGEEEPKPEKPAKKDGEGGSFVTNWVVWAGLAGAFGATGAGFGLWTRANISELEERRDDSANNEFSEVLALEDKAKRNALIANVAFVATGACVVAATVFYFTKGKGKSGERRAAIAPVLSPGQVGVSALITF